MLFCYTGIISSGRMHPYLALFFHRDYFRRPDSSLSCSFAPQGLFCPGQMHPCLPLLSHRDYFHRPDASLSSSFVPQGLFRPAGCISIFLFCSTGIISSGRMHLYLALLLHRDYFDRSDSSLPSSFAPQGLFCPGWMHLYLPPFAPQGLFLPPGFIPSLLFCSTGIISTDQMHLCLPLLSHRDYFHRPNASLSCSFLPQGLFPPAGCISIFLFCFTGIISIGQMHPCLPLLSHRDYFDRPDASLPSSFVPQGLFLPPGCIPSLLFCSTGIISASRMHL